MMELVSEAVAFAVKTHDGMRRKKSEAPYILHPMEAAVIVGTMTNDQELIAEVYGAKIISYEYDPPIQNTFNTIFD